MFHSHSKAILLQAAKITAVSSKPVVALATPNPKALKLQLQKDILPSGMPPVTFQRTQVMENVENLSPAYTPIDKVPGHILDITQQLFSVQPLSVVFIGTDFITVTKDTDLPSWQEIADDIKEIIKDKTSVAQVDKRLLLIKEDYFYFPEDKIIADLVDDVIEKKVRPILREDGGDCVFLGYEKGAVYIRLLGACRGCPFVVNTLLEGVLVI